VLDVVILYSSAQERCSEQVLRRVYDGWGEAMLDNPRSLHQINPHEYRSQIVDKRNESENNEIR